MKKLKLFLILFFGLFILNTTIGQVRFGIQYGYNFANMIAEEMDTLNSDYNMRKGLSVGNVIEIGLSQYFDVRLAPMYIQKGTQRELNHPEFGIIKSSLNLSYAELPILLKFSFNKDGINPYLVSGTSISYLLNAEEEFGDEYLEFGYEKKWDIKDEFKSIDFGFSFGAGLDIPVGNSSLFIEGRYGRGFFFINDVENIIPQIKPVGMQFLAGITLPIETQKYQRIIMLAPSRILFYPEEEEKEKKKEKKKEEKKEEMKEEKKEEEKEETEEERIKREIIQGIANDIKMPGVTGPPDWDDWEKVGPDWRTGVKCPPGKKPNEVLDEIRKTKKLVQDWLHSLRYGLGDLGLVGLPETMRCNEEWFLNNGIYSIYDSRDDVNFDELFEKLKTLTAERALELCVAIGGDQCPNPKSTGIRYLEWSIWWWDDYNNKEQVCARIDIIVGFICLSD